MKTRALINSLKTASNLIAKSTNDNLEVAVMALNMITELNPEVENAKYAAGRVQDALKYGPDMLSSRQLCLEDATSLINTALRKAV